MSIITDISKLKRYSAAFQSSEAGVGGCCEGEDIYFNSVTASYYYHVTNSNGTYILSGATSTSTASYTASNQDFLLLCSGAVDIRLPGAVATEGYMLSIKNIGSNVVRLMCSQSSNDRIDGQLTASIKTTYSSYNIIAATGSWWII